MHPEPATDTRHKRRRVRRWVAVGGVALAAVLVSGVIVALAALREDPQPLGFEPSPTPVAEALPESAPPTRSAAPQPITTSTPEPTATQTETPVPTLDPPIPVETARRWAKVGEAVWGWAELFVGFDGGYVVAGDAPEATSKGGLSAWYSADGVSWEPFPLGRLIEQPCPQSPAGFAVPDSYLTAAASNGTHVLLAGGRISFTPENCANPDGGYGAGEVAWVSSDGRNWTESELFGHQHSVVSSVWPTARGWQAALTSWDRSTSIWESSDGLSWEEVYSVANAKGTGSGRPAVSTDGTWLVVEGGVVMTSNDGDHWRALDTPWRGAVIDHLVPPSHVGPAAWLVVTSDVSGVALTMWTSEDLRNWQHRDLPDEFYFNTIIPTPEGYVGTGMLGTGLTCTPRSPYPSGCIGERQYVSADGLTWSPVTPHIEGSVLLALGPQGVFAVEQSSTGSVWRLSP
jgi:hypothetical protein